MADEVEGDNIETLGVYKDAQITKYREMVGEVFHEISNFEKQLVDMQVAFEDSQRATAVGLQNVYSKFLEFEKRQVEIAERQREIEELLQTEKVETQHAAEKNRIRRCVKLKQELARSFDEI